MLKQKMYHLVIYQLSGIQKGIQSYHAGMEYVVKFVLDNKITPEFEQWIRNDKTVIVLDGGTTNNIGIDYWDNPYLGTMELYEQELINNNIQFTKFHEPDLNNATCNLCFLVDERVWDKIKYPDPKDSELVDLQKYVFTNKEELEKKKFDYLENKYDKKTAFLRMWLKNFRLASN